MPIFFGNSTKNKKDIIIDGVTMQKVYVGDKLVWQKLQFTPINYGALYNWPVTKDSRKVTSSDNWVIPTPSQEEILIQYASTSYTDINLNNAGLKLNENVSTYWSYLPAGRDNSLHFDGRGSGYRQASDGSFGGFRSRLYVLLDCELDPNGMNQIAVHGGYADDRIRGASFAYPNEGCSIRLLWVGAGIPTVYVGNDLKRYEIEKIGDQYWTKRSLYETKFRDGSDIPYIGSNAAWTGALGPGYCYPNGNILNV